MLEDINSSQNYEGIKKNWQVSMTLLLHKSVTLERIKLIPLLGEEFQLN